MGVRGCRDAAWAILLPYRYPGNVRELEHLVQRAVAVARGPQLEVEDLPESLVAQPVPPAPVEGTVAAARQRAEREMIASTLAKHHGEISAAARDLNISRTTMWRLMKRHGLSE